VRRAGAGESTASPTRQSVAVLSPDGDEIQSVELDAEPLKVDRRRGVIDKVVVTVGTLVGTGEHLLVVGAAGDDTAD
jgi:hypothetical protein